MLYLYLCGLFSHRGVNQSKLMLFIFLILLPFRLAYNWVVVF